jgi:hypothetical protein
VSVFFSNLCVRIPALVMCLYSCLSYVSVFLSYLSCVQSACAILCCHLWAVWLYNAFPHYLTHGTIFGKKLIENKTCFLICSTAFSETFLILGRIQRDININVQSVVILVRYYSNLYCSRDFKKILNFVKNCPKQAELLQADRQT